MLNHTMRKLKQGKSLKKIIAILETMTKVGLSRMVTFSQNEGERINHVNINKENISSKGTTSANI